MATTIAIGTTDIDIEDYEIVVPLSPAGVAPTATVTTTADNVVAANDDVTITLDGTVIFDGVTEDSGSIDGSGQRDISCKHRAQDLFDETVTIDATDPTDKDVLDAALADANSGGEFTLDFTPATVALNNDYSVEGRTVKRVFRDMMDRVSNVWWVDPAGPTVHVEDLGGRGLWQALDVQTDRVALEKFTEGSVDSVRNDVEVVGTGAVKTAVTASDSTSISTYGRQAERFNFQYVTDLSEAGALAEALIIPEPLAETKLAVGRNVGNVTAPLVNQTIDLTDASKGIDESGLVIEKQVIRQGRAVLSAGEGAGVNLENINRQSKSRDDITEPGSVYPTRRIEDRAITAEKIEVGTIVAELVDTLDLTTDQLRIGTSDDRSQFIFEQQTSDAGFEEIVMRPETGTPDFPVARIGSDKWQIQEIVVGSISTNFDNALSIGSGQNSYQAVYAYDFIDGDGNSLIARDDDLQSQIDDLDARVTDLENSSSS